MSDLALLPGRLAVYQLSAEDAIPEWSAGSSFFSITRSAGELSVVCAEGLAPEGAKCEGGWRIFQVAGPLDFSMTGVLAAIASPLSEAGVSIFAISTFDTDYVMVKEDQLAIAIDALRAAGHTVRT